MGASNPRETFFCVDSVMMLRPRRDLTFLHSDRPAPAWLVTGKKKEKTIKHVIIEIIKSKTYNVDQKENNSLNVNVQYLEKEKHSLDFDV